MRQAERADIAPRKKSTNNIAACDGKIQVRWLRLIMVDGNPSRARAPQVITSKGLQRIYRRLVVRALDANGDTLTGLEQAGGRHDGNFKLVNLVRFQGLAVFMSLNRFPRLTVLPQATLRTAQPTARELMLFAVTIDRQQSHKQQRIGIGGGKIKRQHAWTQHFGILDEQRCNIRQRTMLEV